MVSRLVKHIAVALSSMALVFAGGISAASASSISNTGPGSSNVINSRGGGHISGTGPYSTNWIGSTGGHYSGSDWHDRWSKKYWDKYSGYNGCWMKQGATRNKPVSKPAPMYPMGNYDKKDDKKPTYSKVDDSKKTDYPNDKKSDDKGHGYHAAKPKSSDKYDKVDSKGTVHETTIKNNIDVANEVNQDAKSGNAKVYGNTNAGSAKTGDAHNESEVGIEIAVVNKTPVYQSAPKSNHGGHGSIHNTGPKSYNQIGGGHGGSFNSSVQVKNNVTVSNTVNQNASSGNAIVAHNTNGGSAKTGDAHNHSNTSLKLDIKN